MYYCLHELNAPYSTGGNADADNDDTPPTEETHLLPQFRPDSIGHGTLRARPVSRRLDLLQSISRISDLFGSDSENEDEEEDPTSSFTGLNGLEIAAVADCKKFLSQAIVQKIITAIWTGDITFWESLSEHTKKKPQFYNSRASDPFTRLRVPLYIKAFEVLFFASFLALYYAVLIERNP